MSVDLSKAVVGSKWKTRCGRIVSFKGPTPKNRSFNDTHPYEFLLPNSSDDWGHTFTKDGAWEPDCRLGSMDDIVAPVEPTTPATTSTNVLQEALAVAGNGAERARDYGHPLDNHERIANFWNVYLKGRKNPDAPISPVDAGYMMVLLKIAREQNTHKRDNIVDMAGYVLCIDQMIAKLAEGEGE